MNLDNQYGVLTVRSDPTATASIVVTPDRSAYASPNGNKVATSTTLDSLFSDDFGGSVINATNWDVLDGGLNAVVSGVAVSQLAAAPVPTFSQGAIGSGTTGMTDSVAASGLTVVMGITNNAERWYLSRQVFAGKEDILVLLSKTQANANNSIFIGLVEVDPTTFVPLLNQNFATEFTNRGGCEFGLSATTTAYQAEAIGDSSASKATGVVGAAGAAWSTTQECLIEIDSRDITISTATIDAVTAKAAGGSRVSSQCPNDKKLYKLVMRFKNVGVPTATSVTVARVLVVDNYEQRVQISTGEGDQIASKGVPVNLVGTAQIQIQTNIVSAGASGLGGSTFTKHKLIAAATTNATSVKGSAGRISGGNVTNFTAAFKYVKFFNKATAPTVGTDVPVQTVAIPPNSTLSLVEMLTPTIGEFFTTGIAYAITGAVADLDATAVAAGDVLLNISYN